MSELPRRKPEVWSVDEAIDELLGLPAGSKILIFWEHGYGKSEEISQRMLKAGIKVSVESWASLRMRPGTIEYQVTVAE